MIELRRAARFTRLLGAAFAVVFLGACGLVPLALDPVVPTFESERFIVTRARSGDTAEKLAARRLGDPGKAWMIEDFNATTRFAPGQQVVIPKRPWNLAGVTPWGYQVVPILVYHNIGPRARGRLVIAADSFEEQMRFLKAQGYRVVRLSDLYEFVSLRRQLPQKAVVLTFDDGYKSFVRYAYPVLRELGFPATLFIYTDYVGAGRDALSWGELRALQSEGFDIQPHSKTHTDLRRRADESDGAFATRMQAELGQPRSLFERQLGRAGEMLAYPYGYYDEAVLASVRAHGYAAAFDVVRLSNPLFVDVLRIHRRQVHAEMTLQDFARDLAVFQEEFLR